MPAARLRYNAVLVTSQPSTVGGPWGRLVRSDALTLAQSLEGGTVDLVYLDPPFGTGADRAMLRGRGGKFSKLAQVVAPEPGSGSRAETGSGATVPSLGRGGDLSSGRDVAYGDPKLDPAAQIALWDQVKRILRPGGAFFLHLDWRTVHATKLLLDDVFGADNFLNEIIWHYATGGIPSRWFARKHDTLLFYVNGPGHTFRRLKEKKYLAHKMSRKGVPEYRDQRGWYRYRFLDDVWEVPWLTQDSKERTGYPTQKPVALLTRILEACTDPGDLVADLFCGSGTTGVAAWRMGRRWILGDESERAAEIARTRLVAEGAVPLGLPEPRMDGMRAGEVRFGPPSVDLGLGSSQTELDLGKEDRNGADGDEGELSDG